MAFWRPFEDEIKENILPESTETSTDLKFQDLHVQCQQMILNMYECLKNENKENLTQSSEKAIVRRINELTRVSMTTIYRIVKNGTAIDHSVKRRRTDLKFRKIDDADRDVLRRIVYNLYKENKVPTLTMIKEKLDSEYSAYKYQSLETLRCILISCGFKHKKLDNRMVIMESRRIVELRQKYLHQIKEFRQSNRAIIYLDETWFDTHDVVRYGWVDDTKSCTLNAPCSRGKRVIILHAGSKNGFVPNALLLSAKNISQSSADYHEDMTADLFEKWFSEQLLPNVSPNSVIVMDNVS